MKATLGDIYNKSHCGYCGQSDTSRSYGFHVFQLSCKEYELLINRGFRRCGQFVYKPDLKESCCPQYTIRLDAQAFRPSKDHRKVLGKLRSQQQASSKKKHKGRDNKFDFLKAIEEIAGNIVTGNRNTRQRKQQPNSPADTGVLHRSSDRSDEHQLRIELEPNVVTKEKFKLYKLYQMAVHNDEESKVTEKSFQRFLCMNPFKGTGEPNQHSKIDTNEVPDGAYHQMYYLNDELVGIGVIDILPNCVSSVYFIWHPDYAHLSLGKVGALFEIALARVLSKPYYYMGFYIESCVKMRYKGQFHPSYILDPQFPYLDDDDQWIPIEEFTSHLKDNSYYTTISDISIPEDQPMPGFASLDMIYDCKPMLAIKWISLFKGSLIEDDDNDDVSGSEQIISADNLTADGAESVQLFSEAVGPQVSQSTTLLFYQYS